MITTVSPKNFECVKELGAAYAYDYKSPSTVNEIIELLKTSKSRFTRTVDYAYAVQLCLDLAAGSQDTSKLKRTRAYDKSGKPYCPDKDADTTVDIFDLKLFIDNADQLVLIVSGTWFSDKAQCDHLIPIALTAKPLLEPRGRSWDSYRSSQAR